MAFKINNIDVSKIQMYGGNIISYPLGSLAITNEGITYTFEDNGAVLINGTSTDNGSYCNLALINSYASGIPGDFYTISGCPDVDGLSMVLVNKTSGGVLAGNNYSGYIEINPDSSITPIMRIRVGANITLKDVEIKPMFNKGKVALPFKPYFEKQVSKLIIKKNGTETVVYNN